MKCNRSFPVGITTAAAEAAAGVGPAVGAVTVMHPMHIHIIGSCKRFPALATTRGWLTRVTALHMSLHVLLLDVRTSTMLTREASHAINSYSTHKPVSSYCVSTRICFPNASNKDNNGSTFIMCEVKVLTTFNSSFAFRPSTTHV